MNIVGYGGGTDSTAMLVGLWQHHVPVDLFLFADPGSGAASHLSLLADHGSVAANTWDAWDHKSVVHRPSGTEADTGTGVPAFRFPSVYRVWLEEVFSQTQSGSSGEILCPLPTMSECLGQRRECCEADWV